MGSNGFLTGPVITAPGPTYLDPMSTSLPSGITMTPGDVEGTSLAWLEAYQDVKWIGDVERRSADGSFYVEWWYVTKNSTFKGTGTDVDEEFGYTLNYDVDIQAKAGWNQVIWTYTEFDEELKTVKATAIVGGEPAGVRWEYW